MWFPRALWPFKNSISSPSSRRCIFHQASLARRESQLLLTLWPTWLFTTLVIYSFLRERERNEEGKRETSLSTRIRTLDVLIGSSRTDRSRSARTVSDLYAYTFLGQALPAAAATTTYAERCLYSSSEDDVVSAGYSYHSTEEGNTKSLPADSSQSEMPRLYPVLLILLFVFLFIYLFIFSHCDVFNQDGKWESEECTTLFFFFPLRTENERGAQKGLYVDPLRYAVVN